MNQNDVAQLLQTIPNYANSQVWQDLIKIKADKKNTINVNESGGNQQATALRKNFTIRSPMDMTKLRKGKLLIDETARE